MTIFAELNRLKNLQNYLQKHDELGKFLTKYNNSFGVREFYIDLEKTRQKDVEFLQKTLGNIFQSIETNKNALKNQEVEDLKSFKKSMIEIQDNLQNINIKLKRDLNKLQDFERELLIELEPFKKKLDEWSQPLNKTPTITQRHKIVPQENTTQEVREFHEFVDRTGGHYNNWSPEDHQQFIKIRKKYQNIEKIVANLQKILPDKSEDSIRDHENWYKNYIILKKCMKESLEKWRENRAKTKIQENTDGCDKIEKHRPTEQNVEEIRTKIAIWKMEKQSKYEQELEMATIKKQQLKENELNKRRMNDEIKESIKKWKEIKRNRDEQERLKCQIIETNLKRQKAIEANRMIKKFQIQDDLYILRRKNSKKTNQKIVERSKSSCTVVERDPGRIFQPTQQWLRKTMKQDKDIDNGISNIPNVYTIAKLKVPEWRKNI